jgi:SAM-dependent methyltransferase
MLGHPQTLKDKDVEVINCIFCNIWSDNIVIEENGYAGRKCNVCGLIYVSPRPKYSQIMNMYSHEKAVNYAESIIPEEFIKRLQARHTLSAVRRYSNGGSLLEIGAGAGYFLDEARRQGFDVRGIEPNRIQADFINDRMKISCEENPLHMSSFNGRKFDVIYNCNVLSHFYDPMAEFKTINNVLRDSGILVFETGNLGDVEKRYYKSFKKFDYPDHLFFFGEKSLRLLIESAGFELIKTFKYSMLPHFIMKKMLHGARDLIKGKRHEKNANRRNTNSNISFDTVQQETGKFNLKQVIKKANIYLSYFSIYKLGRLMPKNGRPQTVIVVARKRKCIS